MSRIAFLKSENWPCIMIRFNSGHYNNSAGIELAARGKNLIELIKKYRSSELSQISKLSETNATAHYLFYDVYTGTDDIKIIKK